ncbi:unnamed protein product [Gongylonema pulchrum]|uniref:G_PROTEIN_RECEP_F1_2 domain-containing protein n=1 Tax=Gongylonema pulchrum TaxID=637853 RepID=A0A183CW62_9BILA|nr:unnamed protein product [Gongylonema pulchrum]
MHATKTAIEILAEEPLMTRKKCFYMIFMHGFSFCISNVILFFIAIDRLIAALLPVKYRTISSKIFVIVTLVVAFMYSAPFTLIGFITADDAPVRPCNPTMGYIPKLSTVWQAKQNPASYRRQVRGTNSMLVMMAIYCCTVLTSAFVLFIANLLPISRKTLVCYSFFWIRHGSVLSQFTGLSGHTYRRRRIKELVAHIPGLLVQSFSCVFAHMQIAKTHIGMRLSVCVCLYVCGCVCVCVFAPFAIHFQLEKQKS